jgi:hypothetical protein
MKCKRQHISGYKFGSENDQNRNALILLRRSDETAFLARFSPTTSQKKKKNQRGKRQLFIFR